MNNIKIDYLRKNSTEKVYEYLLYFCCVKTNQKFEQIIQNKQFFLLQKISRNDCYFLKRDENVQISINELQKN